MLKRIKKQALTPKTYFDFETKEIVDKSDYNSIKQVCVITEDRGNGYQFMLRYIIQNYPEMSGIVIGATGKDSFRYILEEFSNYDAYIIVMDRGISESDFNKINSAFKQFRNNHKDIPMYVYCPNCFEEIFLSFYKLSEYIDFNKSEMAIRLHKDLTKLIKGKIEDVDYTKYKTIEDGTIERVCERLVLELTDNTPFKCKHGEKGKKNKQAYTEAYLSPCWTCPCCTVKEYDKTGYIDDDMIKKCKKPEINCNKMDYIDKHSLLCGLTYIIDKIYGFHFHDNDRWNKINKNYFNKLVKEIPIKC